MSSICRLLPSRCTGIPVIMFMVIGRQITTAKLSQTPLNLPEAATLAQRHTRIRESSRWGVASSLSPGANLVLLSSGCCSSARNSMPEGQLYFPRVTSYSLRSNNSILAVPSLNATIIEYYSRTVRTRHELTIYLVGFFSLNFIGHLLWNSFENQNRTFSLRKINHQSYGPEIDDFIC